MHHYMYRVRTFIVVLNSPEWILFLIWIGRLFEKSRPLIGQIFERRLLIGELLMTRFYLVDFFYNRLAIGQILECEASDWLDIVVRRLDCRLSVDVPD